MTAAIDRLRAMDVGDILDHAVALYRSNFGVLLGIHAVAYVPFWLAIGFSAHLMAGSAFRLAAFEGEARAGGYDPLMDLLAAVLLVSMVSAAILVVEPVATAAMARAVSEQVLGRSLSVRAAYAALRGRVWALILASVVRLSAAYGAYNLLSLAAFGATPALAATGAAGIALSVVLNLGAALAGSVFFVYLAFVGQIIAIERRGAGDALSRCWRLVQGRMWRTGGILGLLGLLALGLAFAFEAPMLAAAAFLLPRGPGPGEAAIVTTVIVAVTALASILGTPVLSVGATLTYYDLRVRREGFDLEMMASSVGEPGAAR